MNEVQSKVFEQIGALIVGSIENAVLLKKQAEEIERLKAQLNQQPAEHLPTMGQQ